MVRVSDTETKTTVCNLPGYKLLITNQTDITLIVQNTGPVTDQLLTQRATVKKRHQMGRRQLARPTRPRLGVAPLPFQLALPKLLQWSISAFQLSLWIAAKSLGGNIGYQLAQYLCGVSWLLGRNGSGAD